MMDFRNLATTAASYGARATAKPVTSPKKAKHPRTRAASCSRRWPDFQSQCLFPGGIWLLLCMAFDIASVKAALIPSVCLALLALKSHAW